MSLHSDSITILFVILDFKHSRSYLIHKHISFPVCREVSTFKQKRKLNMEGLLLLLVVFPCVTAIATDLHSTCQSGEAKEGETGSIDYFVRNDIDLDTATNLLFYIRTNNISGDIVRCDRSDPFSQYTCKHNQRFKSELSGHKLTLVLPNVTLDLDGQYVMHLMMNGSSDPVTNCYFRVLRQNVTSAQQEDKTSVLVIVLPCVFGAACLIIVVVILYMFYRRCKTRAHKRKHKSAEELKMLNTTAASIGNAPKDERWCMRCSLCPFGNERSEKTEKEEVVCKKRNPSAKETIAKIEQENEQRKKEHNFPNKTESSST